MYTCTWHKCSVATKRTKYQVKARDLHSIHENILVYPVTAVNLNKAGLARRNSLELTKNSLVQFSFFSSLYCTSRFFIPMTFSRLDLSWSFLRSNVETCRILGQGFFSKLFLDHPRKKVVSWTSFSASCIN